MGRIRTIKPEFPQSETIGRLSRDSRLLFVQLWTFVDDEGRSRAASRMLASVLFPYDDDAPKLISSWLNELERERCILRYTVEGTTYLQVCNFGKHQKIDHPSKSKIPPPEQGPREPSRKLAPDLVPSTMDHSDLTVDTVAGDRAKPEDEEIKSDNADVLVDERTDLFKFGRKVLGSDSGGLVVKLLKSKSNDFSRATAALAQTQATVSERDMAGRRAYISRLITNSQAPPKFWHKPNPTFQAGEELLAEIRANALQ